MTDNGIDESIDMKAILNQDRMWTLCFPFCRKKIPASYNPSAKHIQRHEYLGEKQTVQRLPISAINIKEDILEQMIVKKLMEREQYPLKPKTNDVSLAMVHSLTSKRDVSPVGSADDGMDKQASIDDSSPIKHSSRRPDMIVFDDEVSNHYQSNSPSILTTADSAHSEESDATPRAEMTRQTVDTSQTKVPTSPAEMVFHRRQAFERQTEMANHEREVATSQTKMVSHNEEMEICETKMPTSQTEIVPQNREVEPAAVATSLKETDIPRSPTDTANSQVDMLEERDMERGQTDTSRGQNEMTRGQTDMTGGQTDMTRGQTDMTAGQTDMTRGQTDMARDQTDMTAGQTDMTRGQTDMTGGHTDMRRGQTDMTGGRTDMTRGQTDMRRGQTDMIGGQTDMTGGQTDMIRGQTDITGGQTDMTAGQTDMARHQTDMTGGRTDMTAGQTDMTRGRTDMTRGQIDMTRGQTDMTGGHTDMRRGQTDMTGGQTDMTRGQTDITGGQTHMTRGQTDMTRGHTDMTGDHTDMTRGQTDMTRGHTDMTGGQTDITRSETDTIKGHLDTGTSRTMVTTNQIIHKEDSSSSCPACHYDFGNIENPREIENHKRHKRLSEWPKPFSSLLPIKLVTEKKYVEELELSWNMTQFERRGVKPLVVSCLDKAEDLKKYMDPVDHDELSLMSIAVNKFNNSEDSGMTRIKTKKKYIGNGENSPVPTFKHPVINSLKTEGNISHEFDDCALQQQKSTKNTSQLNGSRLVEKEKNRRASPKTTEQSITAAHASTADTIFRLRIIVKK